MILKNFFCLFLQLVNLYLRGLILKKGLESFPILSKSVYFLFLAFI
jgi:hypothetical protein